MLTNADSVGKVVFMNLREIVEKRAGYGALRVVVEDRDAVLVEAIGALSPGLMESFKEIEAEAVRLGVSRCATYFHGNDLGMSLIVRWCGFKDDEENGWGMVGVRVESQKELIVGLRFMADLVEYLTESEDVSKN